MNRAVRYRKRDLEISEKITYFLVGGGIGAVIALLLTPKSGEDLREDISLATRKGLEKGRETASHVGTRAGEYYDVARGKAGQYYETTRERAGELYDSASEKAHQLAENARDIATYQGNTLGAAIQAGKQAYYEEKRRSEAASLSEGRPSYPLEKLEDKSGNH